MKIEVINNFGEISKGDWHLNPATVCMAERRDVCDEHWYYLHTTDGGVWRVTEESYIRVVQSIEQDESIADSIRATQRVDTYVSATMRR